MLLLGPRFSLSVIFVASLTHIAHAALRGDIGACWSRNCIFRNDASTICMQADDNGIPLSKCADPILSALLKTHLTNDISRSIAYYDKKGRMLGAAKWRVPSPLTFPVYVCMRGQRRDDPSIDRTICRSALRDNDMRDADAHANECVVEGPSKPYADWCHRTKPAAAGKRKSFFERPIPTGLLWVLGGIVTFGTICGVSAKWGGAARRWLAARRRHRDVVAVRRWAPRMPVPQPHVPP
ncbi:hypothetical protein BKA62DRAFT_831728 [Auriculariales sp. MPI-PUGE-AT-0066]|nr:hypothetical protein BKA62DRAFT_831728 [Auriculariales sp. MPI-PUGE-AT-0066]